MKKLFLLLLVALLGNAAIAQITDYSIFDKKFNFYVANDLGRNGYYDQKPIAELMGQMAENGADPEFVLATGDVHHFEGVRSVNDPLWMTNYELIYSHPELMIDWFPLLGNHEYRGNTQAVLDYSNVSRRWTMPARYYTKTFEDKGATIRILWVDTAPMIDKYRNESDTYPDACKQDYRKQLAWVDSVLSAAKEARDALAEALNSQEDGFGLDAAGVCISDAQRALARLTGEDATEATIDEVFSTFCVGK